MCSGHPGSHSFETLNDTDQIGTGSRFSLKVNFCNKIFICLRYHDEGFTIDG